MSTTPAGTAVITAAAASPATTNTAANPNEAFNLIAAVGASPVVVQSPPVINFTVIDSAGKFVPGLTLAAASAAAVAADPSCSANNVTFAIAKFDSTTGHWQNLISRQRLDASVTTPITRYSVVEGTTDPKPTSYTASATATRKNPDTAVSDPTTRIVGILEENTAGGYYTYRFATDVSTPLLLADAAIGKNVANTAASATAPAYQNRIANNGNVAVKDGKTIHRIGAQLCYTDPATKTRVVVNPVMDFTIGADGVAVPVKASDGKTIVPYRKVVDKASCNECHSALSAHGTRVDPNYCVICHNPGSSDYYNNITVDLRVMVHKLHAAEHLKEWFGTSYKVASVDFSEVTYPQPITNCAKCHDGSKKDAAGNQLAAQGDNWKNAPSRAVCGACHAGIDFATGKGVMLKDAEAAALADAATPGSGAAIRAASIGHIGGSKQNDTQCILCHGAVEIPVYHVTVDPKLSAANSRAWYTRAGTTTAVAPAASSQLNMPAGVYKINYEIKQVTVAGAAGAKKLSVVYRILKDGTPVTLNATGFLMDNVDGSPGIMIAYAVPQDGIASPTDWNFVYSTGGGATVKDIRDGKTPTAAACGLGTPFAHSQTGPDSSGYYTATLGCTIPDNATMVTSALGVTYAGLIQLNNSAYPNGILLREPKFAIMLADGYTARRPIVSGDKCNNCHGQLGILPTFHGGARNNGEGCAMCHLPNMATGHTTKTYSYGGGWSVAVKNLIHGIHGSSKRAQAFSYEATAANPGGFQKVTYPGVLKNCEQCHVAGSYDFSGTANKAALPNLLWTTDAKTNMVIPAADAAMPVIGLSPWVDTLGGGRFDFSTDNLVSSPVASSCFGCHDSTTAVTHMQGNGGTLVTKFSTVSSVGATRPAVGAASTMTFTKKELCMDCHISTSVYGLGIKAVHAK